MKKPPHKPRSGFFAWKDNGRNIDLHAVSFTSFSVSGHTARFGGVCRNNDRRCEFKVVVIDRADPGAGKDEIRLTVTSGPSYKARGRIQTGNIQVHTS